MLVCTIPWVLSLGLRVILMRVVLHGIPRIEAAHAKSSLAITMICRDEGVNFKANLGKWAPIADYYVFMMDNRTQDDSEVAIKSILGSNNKQYSIVRYDFEGFGAARTLSLREAWKSFPQASHVLVADPDWVPDVTTMNLKDLDDSVDVFRFTAFDRNGITKRRMDWLLRQRQGLAMRYSLHEVLDIGQYSVKEIPWVVHEVERAGTWHATVGHAHSMSAARYQFDLQLLQQDLLRYRHDPHVHYYLGITYQAYAEKLAAQLEFQQTQVEVAAGVEADIADAEQEVQRAYEQAVHYLQLRATSSYEDEFLEERWACMFILGGIFAFNKVGI